MRVRAKVRLISFISASVLIILGAGITGYNLANTYKTTIQYVYQRSLGELSDHFTSIKSTLTKGVYANTPPQQYGLAAKLMVEAESAKNALSVFIDAIAVLIITTCVIPILVILFFLWLIKMLFGITINLPNRRLLAMKKR